MTDIGLERGKIVVVPQKSTVEVKKLSKLLVRRRRQILSIYCIVMSLTSLLAFMTKPTYLSSMQIMVSSSFSDEGRLNSQQEEGNKAVDPTFEVIDRTPQIEILLSSKLIQKVVNFLQFDYPDLTVEAIRGKTGKDGRLTVTKVVGNVEDKNILAEIFELSYKDDDPVKAQKVLLAIQNVYQSYTIEQQKERLSKGLSFLNARMPKIRKQMLQAEKQLEKFRKKYNLLDPEIQGKILLESLADVRKQLRFTRAQLQDARARYSNLKKEINSSPQNELASFRLSQSPRYQTLVSEIQKTEFALTQERLRYTENSPTVQKLIQQRQNQVTLLQEEIEQTLGDKTKSVLNTKREQKQLITLEIPAVEPPLAMKGQMAGMDSSKLVEQLLEVQTTVLGLSANEKSLTESEAQMRLELNKYPSLIAEYNRLLPEVETHRKALEHLITTQQSLGLTVARGGYELQVLEEPQRGAYLGSNRFLFILIGALLAPILGVGTAVLSETLSDAISSPQDLQKLSNLRLLGTIPKLPLLSIQRKQSSLPSIVRRILTGSLTKSAIAQDPLLCSQSHETLDMAYQNIQSGFSSPCKSLMLTSARPGEGKSTLALGLAVSAARMHQRVLLIDANLREPNLHKMLALSNDWGLSLLLLEETNFSAKQYIQPVHPSIDVLTAGPIPEDSVKLFSSARMKELLEFFEQNYDLVLVDAPSILGTVNTRLIASYSKGIVMVGRLGQVTSTELVEATGVLSHLNLIGIIANSTTHK
ncbi:GumC family protein [Scytonema sp. NUACC26]|uniref:GumC family protein n=1 Tax=Scytonema sp. NUACC26 TaxID=3140176 RepID=UPI0034DC6863